MAWRVVGKLDLSSFYKSISAVEGEAGRPALDLQLLISLWIYSYSEGVSAAREIARLCEFDPAYPWLTGLQPVNYHSLSDFRVGHRKALDKLFRAEEAPAIAAFRGKMATEKAKQIYRQRGAVAEFPNAWIKTKIGLRQFRLRGLAKVTMETMWACLTYNIQQWIRLRWREPSVPRTV